MNKIQSIKSSKKNRNRLKLNPPLLMSRFKVRQTPYSQLKKFLTLKRMKLEPIKRERKIKLLLSINPKMRMSDVSE
jgi:hypothetical protein